MNIHNLREKEKGNEKEIKRLQEEQRAFSDHVMNLKHQIEEMEDEVHLGNETIIIKESEVGRCFLLYALCRRLSFIASKTF